VFHFFSHHFRIEFGLGSHVMKFSTLIRKRKKFVHYDVILRWHRPSVYVIFCDFSISRKRYKLGRYL